MWQRIRSSSRRIGLEWRLNSQHGSTEVEDCFSCSTVEEEAELSNDGLSCKATDWLLVLY